MPSGKAALRDNAPARSAPPTTIAANRPRTHCKPSPIGDLSTGRRTPELHRRHPHDARRALGGFAAMGHHAPLPRFGSRSSPAEE